MRIKTTNVRRYIDRLKARITKRNVRFLHGFYWLTSLLSSSGRAIGLTLVLIIAFALHFAAFQFGTIIALGFCSLELYFFRAANILLRITRI